MPIKEPIESVMVEAENTQSAGRLTDAGADALVAAFRRAATTVPKYKRLLQAKGIDPLKVVDIDSFKALAPEMGPDPSAPLTGLGDACPGASTTGIGEIGYRFDQDGQIEFLPRFEDDEPRLLQRTDQLFARLFRTDELRTLVISCLDDGLEWPLRFARIRIGGQNDAFVAAMKRITGGFSQVLVLGPPERLRLLFSESFPASHLPEGCRVVWIPSGQWFPLGLQNFFQKTVQHLPCENELASLAPIPLAGFRLAAAAKIAVLRQELAAAKGVSERLLGPNWPVFPMLYQFDPQSVWIEELVSAPGPAPLALTLLDEPPRSPIIRYRTGDLGKIIPYEAMQAAVHGTEMAKLLPPQPLPFLAHAGLKRASEPSPELVFELLSREHELYEQTSGRICIKDFRPARVMIELRKGIIATRTLRLKFSKALESKFAHATTVVIEETPKTS